MKTKLDPRSLLLGAFAGAVAVFCIAAANTNTSKSTESSVATGKSSDPQLEQVTGMGGVFFKAKDPKAAVAWYRANLGIQAKGGHTDFTWREKDHPDQIGHTAWRIFSTNTTYFGQSTSPLMINYRVANMDHMLEQLRRNQVSIEKVQDYDYGRFAWISDPEGNRIELWEPKEK